MSNIHVSPDVLSTLMLLQQGKLQQQIPHDISRNSRLGVFCKKVALKNLRKIHRKTLVLESLFNKVVGLQPVTLLKRYSNTGVFL